MTSGWAVGGAEAAVTEEPNARRVAVASIEILDAAGALDAAAFVDVRYARHALCPAPATGSTRRAAIERDAWADPTTSAMTFLKLDARACPALHTDAFRTTREVAMPPAGVGATPDAAARCASAPSARAALLIGAAMSEVDDVIEHVADNRRFGTPGYFHPRRRRLRLRVCHTT